MILGKFTSLGCYCNSPVHSQLMQPSRTTLVFGTKIHFCKAKIASKLENREGTKGDEKHVATSLLLNVS